MDVSTPSKMRDRLIVALDVPNARAASQLVQHIGDAACIYKVGLQLFTAEGPSLVRELVSSGHQVFLDLKLHDIPNTVAGAVKSSLELGVAMLTVHGSGGPEMLRAAVEAAGSRVRVLAVTVLTSMDEATLHETGVPARLTEQVLHIASLAQKAGCGGVVASPLEIRNLRSVLGPNLAVVIPGIRPAGVDKDDQQRTATPAEAIAAGASHIVVGRPIARAADPALAARTILAEMESVQL